MDFKFFQKIKPVDNVYLAFNMDDALINVIRYRQYLNQEILNSDTDMVQVNVPIVNCFIRILRWRRYPAPPTMGRIEIDYRVIEINTGGVDFTLRMNEDEFFRRIDITGI